MTIELIYYLFLCSVGLFFCFFKIKNEVLYSSITFLLLLLYSVITRFSGFDVDMFTYAEALDSKSWDIYYLKEPMFWVTSRFVYDLVNSAEVTFIIYDILAFLLVIKARSNMKLPQYFVFLYILFFPSVLGINNVLRQFLSCCLFLYLISLFFVDARFSKKIIFSFIAILTHNVAALFSPIVFLMNRTKSISIKGVVMCVAVVALLPVALNYKSNSDTGTLGVGVYLFVLISIVMFILISHRFTLNGIMAKFFYFFIYLISLTSVSAVLMGSAQSKRVGMYALIISLIPLTLVIETCYRQRNLVRAVVYFFLIIPTLIFPNALAFLMTSKM